MTKTLEGIVALVTGASSDIGAATAIALAREGAAVAMAARRKERLEQLAGEIQGKGGRALLIESVAGRRAAKGSGVYNATKFAVIAFTESLRDAISYIVTRPRRVALNELLIRPTEQEV